MDLNVRGKELTVLRRMSVGQLRTRYAEVFGETTNVRHKDWLVTQIIWRMQALAEGDLTDRDRRRARQYGLPTRRRRAAASFLRGFDRFVASTIAGIATRRGRPLPGQDFHLLEQRTSHGAPGPAQPFELRREERRLAWFN